MGVEPQALRHVIGIVRAHTSVEGIAEDRQALMGELDPDLVFAPGGRAYSD